MSRRFLPLPDQVPALTPHLVVSGATEAIAFYAVALGSRELYRTAAPDGRIVLAELAVERTSRIFVADPFPEQGAVPPAPGTGSSVLLHLYVADVDRAFARAVDAGMTVRMPLADWFWGDRYAQLADPFGHVWGLASRIEDLSPEDIRRRAERFYGADRPGSRR
jgi:PhnB protein